MTHEETVRAIHKSLIADDGRASRHGVYAKRRPVHKYEKPAAIDDHTGGEASSDFPGCVE
jgi:hypothetical protein